jgi:hypothetical protein
VVSRGWPNVGGTEHPWEPGRERAVSHLWPWGQEISPSGPAAGRATRRWVRDEHAVVDINGLTVGAPPSPTLGWADPGPSGVLPSRPSHSDSGRVPALTSPAPTMLP